MALAEAIDQIRSSVVQILFSATGLSTDLQQRVGAPFIIKILGTGFFVNSDAHIITARHVIQKGRGLMEQVKANARACNIFVGLVLPNSENFVGNKVLIDFDLVDEDANHDLALLGLMKNPFQGEVSSGIRIGKNVIPVPAVAVQLRPDRPREGQWIGISGYPFQEHVLITNSGYIASVWTMPNYLADAEVNPGNSGGPVYLVEDASVIGVCVASRGTPIWREGGEVARILDQELYYSSGLTHIISTRFVIDLLDRNGAEYAIVTS